MTNGIAMSEQEQDGAGKGNAVIEGVEEEVKDQRTSAKEIQNDDSTSQHEVKKVINTDIVPNMGNNESKEDKKEEQRKKWPEESRAPSKAINAEQDVQQSTAQNVKSNFGIEAHKVSVSGRLSELKRFTLWETKTHFYLVAYNTSQTLFRILKIDRLPGSHSNNTTGLDSKTVNGNQNESETSLKENQTGAGKPEDIASDNDNHQSSTYWSLNVTADRVVYTRSQISEMLDMISEGNKATGGIKEIGRFFGIVGFIRFTSTYYMVLISRRSVVGLLGGHYIYHCDETKIIPVCPSGVLANMGGRSKALDQEEARLLHMFKQVDLSKNFYFSYTYDLTKTLQDNLTKVEKKPKDADDSIKNFSYTAWGYNEKFVWNHHLLMPAFADTVHNVDSHSASEWVLPLVYGFVDQAKLRVLNCTIHVTLIARRSRHFAGARFLKRGTDEQGHVANDVETEQIVSDALTTPFYAPSNRRGDGMRGPNPRYTSYVMHRGSIPIFWTQDSTNMSPRPPIEINVVDPFYSSAALHFDDMLRRYGYPIIILNLIKSKEKQPREVKLLNAFGECIRYLNQFLPKDKRLRYIAWDMSRASKSRDQDVIGVLEDIAEETINATKFFHSGPEPNKFSYRKVEDGERGEVRKTILLQSGVARVNCVDCLDRTNAAQFVIGKAALGHQLYALGLLDHPNLPFDSDAIDMLTEMYHDLGDTIALQYGGSHLVNTMETYRKINQWSSHSRDMLEGLKRYYSNSFVDAEKQAAINLFLGVDNEAPDFKHILPTNRRHYQNWFTPAHLEKQERIEEREVRLQHTVEAASNFWAEYYRPSLFTDLMRHHAFKMTAIHQQLTALSQASPPSSQQNPPSSPAPSHISSTSISSPVKSISSPRSRTQRLRHDSSNLSSYRQSQTIVSPFTSRIPLPSTASGSSVHMSTSPSSPKGGISNQRALIGGVRKWISLNRGEEEDGGKSSQTTSRKVSSKKLTDAKTTKDDETVEFEKTDSPEGMGHILSSTSAWPTWDEITGAHVAAPTTGTLLTNLMNPEVSVEEVKEYTSWLDQFRDVTFDAGPHEIVPEPAALMQATQTESMSSSMIEKSGMVFGSDVSALAPSGLILPLHLHSIGQRKPATQKQRQQIAEADARLYDREVALAGGKLLMTNWNERNEQKPNSAHPTTIVGEGIAQTNTMTEDRRNRLIEPALLHYPLTKNALGAPASEAKLRAYTHWLAGHNTGLPIVLGPSSSH